MLWWGNGPGFSPSGVKSEGLTGVISGICYWWRPTAYKHTLHALTLTRCALFKSPLTPPYVQREFFEQSKQDVCCQQCLVCSFDRNTAIMGKKNKKTDHNSYCGVTDKTLLNSLKWFESLESVCNAEIIIFPLVAFVRMTSVTKRKLSYKGPVVYIKKKRRENLWHAVVLPGGPTAQT